MPPLRAHEPASWLPRVARDRQRRQHVRVVEHRRAEPGRTGDDRFAVVVITHNRCDELVRNLSRLRELPERPHVTVVDNASTDGTADAVRERYPDVDLLVLDRNAGAVGRNLAVERVTSPYVAFADDDTWWAPGSLPAAADVLDRHPQLAVVTARIVVEPAGVEDGIVADMRDSPLPREAGLPGHPLLSFLAGASMVRRSAYLEVGGFDPRLRIGGEEELMAADLAAGGWAMRYLPELTVHHAASRARDPHRRRADGVRNTLWTTWLRRPPARALWRSWALVTRAPRDVITLRAIGEALRGLPWVLARRHALPPEVEWGLTLLDGPQLASRARRYVS